MSQEIPPTAWRELVSRIIKMELTKRKLRYEDLSQKLHAVGVSQTADNLRNKINRGILGADLFLQIVYVLEIRTLERHLIEDVLRSLSEG